MIEQFDAPFLPYRVGVRPSFRGTAYLFWIDPARPARSEPRDPVHPTKMAGGWRLVVQDRGGDSLHGFWFNETSFDRLPRQRRWRPVMDFRPALVHGWLAPDWQVGEVAGNVAAIDEYAIFEQMVLRIAELTAWSWTKIGPEQRRQIARDVLHEVKTGEWRT